MYINNKNLEEISDLIAYNAAFVCGYDFEILHIFSKHLNKIIELVCTVDLDPSSPGF